MRLRPRTFLIVAATSTVFMLALIAALPPILLRSYYELEKRDARLNANRVATALDETLSELGTKVADWASWDDTYKYIKDRNPAFLRSNLLPATFDLLRIDAIAFLDVSDQVVYGRQHDAVSKAESPLPSELIEHLGHTSLLLRSDNPGDRAGIVMLRDGPMLVVTRPILTSEAKGPSRGTVLFGRRLGPQEVSGLAHRTLLDLRLHPMDDPHIATEAAALQRALVSGDSVTVAPIDGKTLQAIRVLRDTDHRPVLMAEVRLPRDIVAQGWHGVRTALVCVLLTMLLMGALTMVLVEQTVLRRMTRLNDDVSSVRRSHDPGDRVTEIGSDELGQLAHGVNTMLEAIQASQHELLAARDAAEAANRAKSQFLATMSHEIRTPMNGVLGMTAMLLQTSLSPEQRDYTRLAHFSAESLLDLLNDILDLSKIEAGRMTLECIPFDLVELLEDLAELLSVRAQERGLEIVVHVTPGTPRCVVGDPVRLRQVVLNLVGNAIKFTERGSVTIQLSSRSSPGGRTLVRLNVIDTGAGIAPEVQSRLFNPFAQADASTARRFGGTGLGLAICKRLVSLMGGTIQLTSVVGKGSTFGFELELDHATIEGTRAPWPSPPPRRRVLVVDDLDASRASITDALKEGRVDAVVARSATEALVMLRDPAARPVDAIVADAPLDDLDPAAFAQALQAPGLAAIPRIMLAARPKPGAAAVAEVQGWSAYLPKPTRCSVLLAVIEATTRAPSARQKGLVTRHSIAEAMQIPGAEGTDRQEFAGVVVLVADDLRVNQIVAKCMFESLGCRVEVVGNGLEVVSRVKRGGVDVVFMDMQMPELDGLEATRAIRAMEGPEARIPIVALSAGVLSDERAACLDAGMNEFVAKPVRPEELARALRGALLDRTARAA